MKKEQIKSMVNRFLSWKLPSDFSPDGGISFEKTTHGFTREPIGTNLFTAVQAEEMVRYMLDGQDAQSQPSEGREQACIDRGDARCVYQETKDCPKASNPAVDLQKLAEETSKKYFEAIYAGCKDKKSIAETAGSLETIILSALRAARGLE